MMTDKTRKALLRQAVKHWRGRVADDKRGLVELAKAAKKLESVRRWAEIRLFRNRETLNSVMRNARGARVIR